MSEPVPHLYKFDGFRLDATNYVLERSGVPVHVPHKALELLIVLVRHRGEILGKEFLFNSLWPDTVVEEANLTQNIYVLRKILGESAHQPQYIETIPRRGYRFHAEVREHEGAGAASDLTAPVPAPRGQSEPRLENAEGCAASARAGGGGAPPTSDGRRRPRLVLVGLCVLVPLAVALMWGAGRRETGKSSAAVEAVAILPFRTVGARGADDHLGLGMTDTLITRLSGATGLTVRPTSAVLKYEGDAADPPAAGRELGVDAVMDGTVQREGNSVRVTVRLVAVEGGRTLWAETFDEPFTNVFALQDTISERVVSRLRLRLSGGQWKTMSKQPTTNTEAYQAYAEGLFFWNKRTREGLAEAINCFERAVEKDPQYALAFAALSDSYYLVAFYGFDILPRAEALERARAAARHALELDASLAEAHLAMAMVSQNEREDWPAAERHFRLAADLNPSNATVRQRYGWFLLSLGRLAEGVEQMRRSRELDPVSPVINNALLSALIYARQYDEATAVALRTLELDPGSRPARFNLALAYGQKGMYREAISELKKLRERDPEGRAGSAALEALAITYALAGRKGEAEKTLREVLGLVKGGGVSAYNVALIYVALDRKEEAFAWLEKAPAGMRGQSLAFMYDPHLDPLRSDPSFKAFLLRHRIPTAALFGQSARTRAGSESKEFGLCESGLIIVCPKTAGLLAGLQQSR